MLPGWYGFGSAVKSFLAADPDGGLELLQSMYREWPFFRTLLSNMDMVLAKTSIAIASRYAELVPDINSRESIFERIRVEWSNTIEALLAIMEQTRLLQSNPLLERSIRNRFPYLDPLNHIQIKLMIKIVRRRRMSRFCAPSNSRSTGFPPAFATAGELAFVNPS
jgi:phosphoenolpyruvate carboxylase